MIYYYQPDPSDPDYPKQDQTDLRTKVKDEAKKFLPQIKELYPDLEIGLLWTQKNTFGWVFADFKKTYKGRTIGRGEKDLFRMLREKYVCVVLSEKIPDPFSEISRIEEGEIFRLNFKTFREYLSIFGKTSDVVAAFLRGTIPTDIDLEVLRTRVEEGTAIDEKHKLEKFLEFIETYPEEKIDDLKLLIDRLPRLPRGLKLSSDQVSQLLTFIDSASEGKQLSAESFSKFLKMASATENIEFSDEDAVRMIGMLDRFSKIYHIKSKEDLEKILGSVINFLEENELSEPSDFNRLLGSVEKISTYYKISGPDDFDKILELCRISDSVIKANYDYFQEKLAEFRKKIDDPSTTEKQIQDFVTEHRWLIDFKFWSYDIIEKEKELAQVGRIDLYMAKKQFKTVNIAVVEFKKPDLTVTDSRYRVHKPVLTKGVVSALNQTMHYIENLPTEPYDIVEGWVIAGRKNSENDYFVEIFDKYVHGIKTLTFDNLYDKAKGVVDAFSSPVVPLE